MYEKSRKIICLITDLEKLLDELLRDAFFREESKLAIDIAECSRALAEFYARYLMVHRALRWRYQKSTEEEEGKDD